MRIKYVISFITALFAIFYLHSPLHAEPGTHSLGISAIVGRPDSPIHYMFGGYQDGTKRMASLEYEYRWKPKFSVSIMTSAEHTDAGSSSSLYYNRDGFGIEGSIKFYPFRRIKGFHVGGIIGGWYVDWEEERQVYSTQSGGYVREKDEGTSLALRVSSQLGYRFTFNDRFYIDPNFYFGYFEIPWELYIAVGLSTGIIW